MVGFRVLSRFVQDSQWISQRRLTAQSSLEHDLVTGDQGAQPVASQSRPPSAQVTCKDSAWLLRLSRVIGIRSGLPVSGNFASGLALDAVVNRSRWHRTATVICFSRFFVIQTQCSQILSSRLGEAQYRDPACSQRTDRGPSHLTRICAK